MGAQPFQWVLEQQTTHSLTNICLNETANVSELVF